MGVAVGVVEQGDAADARGGQVRVQRHQPQLEHGPGQLPGARGQTTLGCSLPGGGSRAAACWRIDAAVEIGRGVVVWLAGMVWSGLGQAGPLSALQNVRGILPRGKQNSAYALGGGC